MSRIPPPPPPSPRQTIVHQVYCQPAPATKRDKPRNSLVWFTYAACAVWSLIPLIFIAMYGLPFGLSMTHWLTTGAVPLPMLDRPIDAATLMFFVWLRFNVPAMFAILIAESAHAIACKS